MCMRIGMQTGNVVDVLGFEKGYAAIKNAGFDAIDWNLDHAVKYRDLVNGTFKGTSILEKPLFEVIEYYAEELACIRKYGLEIYQAHAPFPSYVFNHPDSFEYMVNIFKRNVEYCGYAGIQNLVIHVIQRDSGDDKVTSEELEDLNTKLYSSLIPELVALGGKVKVCVENNTGWLPVKGRLIEFVEDESSCPEHMASFIDKLNEMAGMEVFAACYDIGHGNLIGKTPKEYIEPLGKRLSVLHVHDNDGLDDSHLMPFTGTVNWNEFCASLKKIGYDGVISFETFHSNDIGYAFSEEMCLLMVEMTARIGKAFSKRIEEEL